MQAPPYDDLYMKGRFIFEISPNQVLLLEGPWALSSSDAEWEIAIMPFKPHKLDSPRFLNARHSRIVRREDLSGPSLALSLEWATSPHRDFSQSFQELQELIAAGKVQKGVPWAYQTAPLATATHYWEKLLSRAQMVGPSLVLYGAELESESVLGATPEWLFRIEAGGRVLHTMALAGTRWPGQERNHVQEKKDAREHELVVNDIQQRLSVFGEVTAGKCEWFKAGSVEHLRTPIELKAHSVLDATELLKILHPTPAVGVFPRTPEGQEWLYSLPGHETRADYAAPWVVRNRRDGRVWALVALRQMRLRADHIFIPAGCGVIADSLDEVEWNEIQQKIQSVKKGWGLQD
jgi:menaquinone-specific isochorismate synthase